EPPGEESPSSRERGQNSRLKLMDPETTSELREFIAVFCVRLRHRRQSAFIQRALRSSITAFHTSPVSRYRVLYKRNPHVPVHLALLVFLFHCNTDPELQVRASRQPGGTPPCSLPRTRLPRSQSTSRS